MNPDPPQQPAQTVSDGDGVGDAPSNGRTIYRWDDGSGIQALESFDDGSGTPALVVGGTFNKAGGLSASNIARWHPSLGWKSMGSGFNGSVLSLERFDLPSGSRLYAGGSFTKSGSTSTQKFARWSGSSFGTAGSWAAVAGGLTGAPSSAVSALQAGFEPGAGPRLYVGGAFTKAGSVNVVFALLFWESGLNGLPALYAGGAAGGGRGFAGNEHRCAVRRRGACCLRANSGEHAAGPGVVDADDLALLFDRWASIPSGSDAVG